MKKKIYWSIGISVTTLIGIVAFWFHDTGSKTSQFTGPVSPEEPVPQELVASLEKYVLELMEEYEVPGAAMVLLKGDQVIYAKGWGVTDLAAQTPVTTRTLFGIGSSTKSMTSIMVASKAPMISSLNKSKCQIAKLFTVTCFLQYCLRSRQNMKTTKEVQQDRRENAYEDNA